jgi:hypothetical protein
MKTRSNSKRYASAIDAPVQFCRKLIASLEKLKARLQEQFERAHPGRSQIIRQVVAEAEELAWQTSYPHLFLPDFAEAKLAEIVAVRGEPALARPA